MHYILVAVMMLGLASCSKPPNAVLKKRHFTREHVIATDSRLRVVNNADISFSSIPGEVDPRQIICTEPSPDVATAIANSFGTGISLLRGASGSFTATHVEGLVQLGERTATIQLLRDKMYQTCLAYANGAISGTTYSFIMSRLDDTIVTLLLGETAGGAFGRGLASVGGKGGASASAILSSLPGQIADLDKRIEAATAAEEELRTAEDNLAQHEAITPEPSDKDQHDTRTVELEGIVNKARGKRDAAQSLMKDSMKAASESTAEISEIESGGDLEITPSPLIADTLADMQAEFLLQDASLSIMTACLVELGRKIGTSDSHAEKKATAILLNSLQTGRTAEAVEVANTAAKARAHKAAGDALRMAASKAVEAADLAADARAAWVEASRTARAAENAKAIRNEADRTAKAAEAAGTEAAKTAEAAEAQAAKATPAEVDAAVRAAEAARAEADRSAKNAIDARAEADRATRNAADAMQERDETAKAAEVAEAKANQANEDARVALDVAGKASDAAMAADDMTVKAAESTEDGEDPDPVNAKRITGSELANFCSEHLLKIIKASSTRHHAFRTHKANLRAKVDELKYEAQVAAASALANETFVTAIGKCETVEDVDVRVACLKKLFSASADAVEPPSQPDPVNSP